MAISDLVRNPQDRDGLVGNGWLCVASPSAGGQQPLPRQGRLCVSFVGIDCWGEMRESPITKTTAAPPTATL